MTLLSDLSGACLQMMRRSFRSTATSLVSAEDYCHFLDRRATFIAQKGLTQTLRSRIGVFWPHASQEARFQADYVVACWHVYRFVFADLLEITAPSILKAMLRDRIDDDFDAIRHCFKAHLSAFFARHHEDVPVTASLTAWDDYVEEVSVVLFRGLAAMEDRTIGSPDRLGRNRLQDLKQIPFLTSLLISDDFPIMTNFLRLSYVEVGRCFTLEAVVSRLADDLVAPPASFSATAP